MQGPGLREQQLPQEFGKQKLEPADDAEKHAGRQRQHAEPQELQPDHVPIVAIIVTRHCHSSLCTTVPYQLIW